MCDQGADEVLERLEDDGFEVVGGELKHRLGLRFRQDGAGEAGWWSGALFPLQNSDDTSQIYEAVPLYRIPYLCLELLCLEPLLVFESGVAMSCLGHEQRPLQEQCRPQPWLSPLCRSGQFPFERRHQIHVSRELLPSLASG